MIKRGFISRVAGRLAPKRRAQRVFLLVISVGLLLSAVAAVLDSTSLARDPTVRATVVGVQTDARVETVTYEFALAARTIRCTTGTFNGEPHRGQLATIHYAPDDPSNTCGQTTIGTALSVA